LRIGWCVASPELIRRCVAKKHLTTISNSLLCESVALAVLKDNEDYLRRARTLCREGLAHLRGWAEGLAAVRIVGASQDLPFAWIALAPGLDSLAIARDALGRGVMVVPGEVFGQPGHLRIAIGRRLPELADGLRALAAAIEAHTMTTSSVST
jgi:DNA-binding transcriptional MocR family regulator